MTDLHGRVSAALDREQALAEAATLGPWEVLGGWIETPMGGSVLSNAVSCGAYCQGGTPEGLGDADAAHIAAQNPARTLRRIASEREVLELHAGGILVCTGCRSLKPCADLRLLAARCDVAVNDD